MIKKICKKAASIIEVVFGYGILICLFGGGLSFFGYLVALIIGGEAATQICTVIYKNIYPYMVYLSTAMVLLGLVKMYLCGEVALNAEKKKETTNKRIVIKL